MVSVHGQGRRARDPADGLARRSIHGITPEEMMRVINRDLPTPLSDIDLGTLLQPNYGGFLRKSVTFPLRVAGVARELVTHIGEISAVDVATSLASALPTGI